MKEYRKRLRNRMLFSSIGIIGLVATIIFGISFNLEEPAFITKGLQHFVDHFSESYMVSFRAGICGGGIGVMLYILINSVLCLRNEKRMKKIYIKETDEREKEIQYRSTKTTIAVCAYLLLIAIFIVSLFNHYTVLIVLYIVTMVICTVKLISMLYYRRKL